MVRITKADIDAALYEAHRKVAAAEAELSYWHNKLDDYYREQASNETD